MSQRRILVTSALPYANGHIHIGHLVEYIQTDIWVRFQRLRGHRCVYVCADDTHGTAIMIRAQQEGRSEEQVIAEMSQAHQRDFSGFQIEFDHYGSTHASSNQALSAEFWAAHRRAGLVFERAVDQLYDPERGVFLADRFVKGTCPSCGAQDQNGDNCSSCGATYSPVELIQPYSTLSGAQPEIRRAEHLFVDLEQMRDFLVEWTQSSNHLQPEIANYLNGHFLRRPRQDGEGFEPLKPWDVSRPAPYFGFEIPDSPGNYWYVWFDAPIGYLASTRDWCDRTGEDFDLWWRNPETEVYHFIGKDITYFHTLFWPAMLKTAGFNLPTRVQIHGFLTVNGQKMSKSTGTFVMASTYLKHLDPAYLRYYYASKLGSGTEDLDLSLEEFVARTNSDLVGKVVNLASRTARFVERLGLAERYPDDGGLFAQAAAAGEEIADAYETCDYARAMRLVRACADRANEYVDRVEPWKLAKRSDQIDRLQEVCTVALNLYRQISIYLAPVLPRLAEQSAQLLHAPLHSWDASRYPTVGTAVGTFKHLMQRVDAKRVQAMIAETADAPAEDGRAAAPDQAAGAGAEPALDDEPLAAECTIDDFAKVDLRVARIVEASHVPGAKKLVRLSVSLGGDERRTLFAGIKAAYEPASLVGRLVVVVANLALRQMKFGTSEGMVLAVGSGEREIYLLAVDSGAKPGQRVR
jgi:methionyl-tRNA synthetase